MVKVCTKCKGEKRLEDFYNRADQPDGKNLWCKECCKDYDKKRQSFPERIKSKKDSELKRLYGIELQEVEKMLCAQEGRCKICSSEILLHTKSEDKNKALCVDHCHTSGSVRGLLCNSCNRGLGFFKEDTSIVLRAYQYLVG